MRKPSGVRGEDHPSCKLSDEQVREIYRRANEGELHKVIAHDFNVYPQTVSGIKLGKRWKHLNLGGSE